MLLQSQLEVQAQSLLEMTKQILSVEHQGLLLTSNAQLRVILYQHSGLTLAFFQEFYYLWFRTNREHTSKVKQWKWWAKNSAQSRTLFCFRLPSTGLTNTQFQVEYIAIILSWFICTQNQLEVHCQSSPLKIRFKQWQEERKTILPSCVQHRDIQFQFSGWSTRHSNNFKCFIQSQ